MASLQHYSSSDLQGPIVNERDKDGSISESSKFGQATSSFCFTRPGELIHEPQSVHQCSPPEPPLLKPEIQVADFFGLILYLIK